MSVSATGAEEKVSAEKVAGDWAPMGFVYLLWIAVFSIAQMLLTNTVEEKSNRIIEVLLSSVSAHQLMTGKILGIAATGLTMIGSWVIFALIGIKIVDLDLRWVSVIRNPLYLASFIGYFLAGYMIYAAVLVAIGSVCNSLKEAQNLMQPVILLLMVPLIAMVFVVQDPNGTVSRILTYVPIYTPFLMMNRAGGPPPAWEYVATTILIVATIAVSFWAAGRVFRVGVLMTGKPPKLREIVGWMMRPTGDATPVR
jgi:ABC-2 type transport system permease protein